MAASRTLGFLSWRRSSIQVTEPVRRSAPHRRAAAALVRGFGLTSELRSSSLRPERRKGSVIRHWPVSPGPASSRADTITAPTLYGSARSSAAETFSTTCRSPARAALRTRSIWEARRDRGAREAAPDRLRRRCRMQAAGGLVHHASTELPGRSGGTLVHYRRIDPP